MNLFRSSFLALASYVCAAITLAHAQPVVGDHVTPSGLAFRYVHMPEAQEQTIQFGWRDGLAFARNQGQGLAVLGPSLVLQGPKGMSRGEFAEDLKDLQARLSLQSSPSYTMGGVNAPHAKFGDAIELFAKVLAEPALDGGRLDELRKQYQASLRQQAANAGALAHRVAAQLLHGDSALRDWHGGSPAVYDDVTVEDVAAWRASVFVREGLVIASAGPFTPQQAAEQIDRLFASLPAKGTALSQPGFARAETSKSVVLETTAPQTHLLVIGWTGFKPDHELVSGQIAARVLRARLFKAVRERLGASYGASAQLLSPVESPYLLSFSAAVAHDKGVEALAAMKAEFEGFVAKGITAAELDAEKSKLASEIGEMFRRPPNVAALLRNAQLTGRPADHVTTAMQRMRAVTQDMVNGAIAMHLGGKAFLTLIVAPAGAGFQADCTLKAVEEAARCR